MQWNLWTYGTVISQIRLEKPLLASWNHKDHVDQLHLTAYRQRLKPQLADLAQFKPPFFLHLDIDVQTAKSLTYHHDLENYLTPLFEQQLLDSQQFVLVSAAKYVGYGSQLTLGLALPTTPNLRDWHYFGCSPQGSTIKSAWKQQIRTQLANSQPRKPTTSHVALQMVWRHSSKRNWMHLWKSTGDSLGPILGEPYPNRPFYPNDDRITSLILHSQRDESCGFAVDVGVWWNDVHGLKPTFEIRNDQT